MSNPTINFRLSPYQLARGLQVIRQLEPTYQITSISQIVKVIYHDYLAKMSLNLTDEVPQDLLLEINSFIKNPPASKGITLDELMETVPTSFADVDLTEKHTFTELPDESEESEISSVSDFSPPDEWKEDNDK